MIVPVVDASVVLDWIAPDADPEGAAIAVLQRLTMARDDVLAPRLLREEVANGLLTGIRRQRWTGQDADRAFRQLDAMPVAYVDEMADLRRAWNLSRRYDEHPIYDLVYVALAERLDLELLTADAKLVNRLDSPRLTLVR